MSKTSLLQKIWKIFLLTAIVLFLISLVLYFYRSNFQSSSASASALSSPPSTFHLTISPPSTLSASSSSSSLYNNHSTIITTSSINNIQSRSLYSNNNNNNLIKDSDLTVNLNPKLPNLNVEDFFRNSRQQFLTPETIHSPFNPPPPIEELSAIPLAFGDFDSDKFTDIYMLANNGTSIQLLKGHHCVDGRTILTIFGSRNCLSRMQNFSCDFNRPIYNLVGSDFTGATQQDLLITIESENSKTKFDIVLVNGSINPEEFHCEQSKILFKDSLSEPFILDYNGDMITDFIIETEKCSLQLILGGPFDDPDMTSRLICLSNLSEIKHLARPHSSGFLNLNLYSEDLTPDLFINGEDKFEYIYNIPGSGFLKKRKIFNFPKVLKRGQSAFADIDYDGKLDHLIPVCKDSTKFEDCQEIQIMLFEEKTEKWLDILYINRTNLGLEEEFNNNRTFTFVEQKIYEHILVPVTLHFGDYNYDGYPDFATILQDTKTKKNIGGIFLNEKSNDNESKCRIFKLDSIIEYEDSVQTLTPFDIYNNGRLNLLLTTKNESSKNLETNVYDYYLEKSIYFSFLRVNIISGLCSDKSEQFLCPKHLAFGSPAPGVSVCFQGPLANEHSCSFQMGQSAHFAMQLPYIIFGLGDTLNVINDMSISIANGNASQISKEWNEIIPGSNLVIIPFEPVIIENWELRVFINMSIYSIWALLFLLILGLLLLLAISILHFLEKLEDRVDHKQYRTAWL